MSFDHSVKALCTGREMCTLLWHKKPVKDKCPECWVFKTLVPDYSAQRHS